MANTAYRGHPAMPEAEFRAWVERYHAAGLQLAIHGNGDASIDLIIEALMMANEHYPRKDTRHIVVHAQTIRADLLQTRRARALRAMTIDSAWQNHLETDRGSLEAGKLADIVVLSGDPLQVDDVRKLHVQHVWIGGRNVYRRNPDSPV